MVPQKRGNTLFCCFRTLSLACCNYQGATAGTNAPGLSWAEFCLEAPEACGLRNKSADFL